MHKNNLNTQSVRHGYSQPSVKDSILVEKFPFQRLCIYLPVVTLCQLLPSLINELVTQLSIGMRAYLCKRTHL